MEVEEENATQNTSPEDLFERLEAMEGREQHIMVEDEPVEDDASDIEELETQTTPKKRKIIEEDNDEFEGSTNPDVNEIEHQEENMSDGQDENNEDEDEMQEESMNGQEQDHEDTIVDEPSIVREFDVCPKQHLTIFH
uniref:Uncharacterized protein n=1 Tax=Acrobeloides nanus TaxID=290746 RepID=A0A914CWZ2_9BILA